MATPASADTAKPTSPLLIAAAWLLVLLPASWGLRYTVANALKIFVTSGSPAPASAAPAPAPTAPTR